MFLHIGEDLLEKLENLNITEFRSHAELLWRFHSVYDTPIASDAIVGLGSYDLRVASRCAELFRKGFADHIVFSGGSGNWTEDLFPATEAEAFRDQAISEGIPEDAIHLEKRATNIGENIRFCAEILPAAQQVIIVTKPQTQLRARATADKQWPDANCLVTAPKHSFDDQPLAHHGYRALVCEMVGDLARMDAYARSGFQTGVSVSTDVRSAFDALVAAGFVDHLPKAPSHS
ncbi:YdcF family protein [Actibacterium sp. 188UL27-1]|uniref:YdcF family protein n=1 Tax=Actibacterium sp. 188UL27-1 TaxID=2786961 RepID=UPI00195F02BC|nr:YdcF family protein [Actibacterium sp. 188UL27-1]MBM7066992.1 YdcF family protein [Actibacterium sp. 188UL27-1]